MRSLRRQLTVGLLLAFALLLGTGGGAIYWAMRTSLYRQFDAVLQDKAQVVMSHVRQQDGRILVYFSDFFLSAFDETGASGHFQVFNKEGRSIERSTSLGIENLPVLDVPADEPLLVNGPLPDESPGRFLGIRFRPEVESIRRNQEPVNALVVVAASRDSLEETLAELRLILVGTWTLVLVVAALAVRRVLERSLLPVQRAASAASQITAETLDRRLEVEDLPVELHPLTEKVNDLLARLEASFERERRFSSDLAHELRTPLAELRSIAEIALKWPDDRSPDVDRNVLEIALQIESRVETLLALASAEQGSTPQERKQLMLQAEIDQQMRTLRPRFEERQLRVEMKPATIDCTLTTDPVLFRSILGNLLENAASYAPEASAVEILVEVDSTHFSLSVRNQADLDPADLDKLFDRFWRKDPARSGDNHAGLGLSLAHSYAELLGLRLEAFLENHETVLRMRISGKRG